MKEKCVSPFQAPRRNLRGWRNQRGQDLIEYGLMAGFVIVAAMAIMPGVTHSIDVIFTKISVALRQDERKNPDGSCNSPSYVVFGKQCLNSVEFDKLYKLEEK